MAYTKLFNSIITSTIWSEDDRTRIVWITMMAMADRNGEVQGTVPGLARIAGVPTEDCRAALTRFLSPDPDSRTKDDEGRRIQEIDGGWALLNHGKYRDMASDADRKEKAAIRQRRFQARSRSNDAGVTHSNADVTPEITPRVQIQKTKEESDPLSSPVFVPKTGMDDDGDLFPSRKDGKAAKKPRPQKPKDDTESLSDPRHHEITSRIGEIFQTETGQTFSCGGKFLSTLKRFLTGCSVTSDEWLATYSAVLNASRRPFAKMTIAACDPAVLCQNWNAVVGELDKLESDASRESRKSPGSTRTAGFKCL